MSFDRHARPKKKRKKKFRLFRHRHRFRPTGQAFPYVENRRVKTTVIYQCRCGLVRGEAEPKRPGPPWWRR
jgi:hypothetical protein